MPPTTCSNLQKEWHQCLAKSNRNPGKCTAKEEELIKCGKQSGERLCVDETVALMSCTKKASLSDLCSKQFILMRECHRPNGPELLAAPDGGWVVAQSAAHLYEHPEALRVEPSVVGWRQLSQKVKEVAKDLGVGEGGLRF